MVVMKNNNNNNATPGQSSNVRHQQQQQQPQNAYYMKPSSNAQTIMNGGVASNQRDQTPMKGGFAKQKQTSAVISAQNQNNILSSEERKVLFNTFMKEMNQSMHSNAIHQNAPISTANGIQIVTSKKGAKKTTANMNESIKHIRNGMSNPSSRPRSQLGGTQNQTQNLIMVGGSAGNNTSNYASLMATAQTQGIATNPTNGPLKYKFVNSTTNSSGTQQQNINNNHQLSRNVQINKIKDFFIHHTYSANLNGTGGGGINGGGIMSQSMCGPQATVRLFLI